jgi:hypothetical protein
VAALEISDESLELGPGQWVHRNPQKLHARALGT